MTHAARTGVNIPRLKHRLRNIVLGLMIVALFAAMVLLLPILLPAVAISEAWTIRKLARTRCVNCGEPIGLAEIQRAKQDALDRAGAAMSTMLAALPRPRIVVVWDVACPTCGHKYTYGSTAALRPALVSKELGSSEQTA